MVSNATTVPQSTTTPPPSDARTPHNAPVLPPELIAKVVGYLEPVTDRVTLRNLVLVSTSLWEISAPILYSKLKLDLYQLHKLLEGSVDPAALQPSISSDAPPVLLTDNETLAKLRNLRVTRGGQSVQTGRAQRAFGFIKRIHFYPPPVGRLIDELWALTIPNIPLFPAVRDVCVEDRPLPFDPYYPTHLVNQYPVDDVFIFDAPNMCVRGRMSYEHATYLDCRAKQAFTTHLLPAGSVFAGVPHPRTWTVFRLFHESHRTTGLEETMFGFWPTSWEDQLWFYPEDNPPIQVYIKMSDTTKAQYLAVLEHHRQWVSQPSTRIKLVLGEEEPDPCVVCGCTWGPSPVEPDLVEKLEFEEDECLLRRFSYTQAAKRDPEGYSWVGDILRKQWWRGQVFYDPSRRLNANRTPYGEDGSAHW